jgi:hypothetical protein
VNGDWLVGVRLEAATAVVAVVRPQPLRLTAVAEVELPLDLSRRDQQLAERAFARTRRQLGLPRWYPVALSAEPGPAVAAYAVLLARVGLPVGAMPPTDAARRHWSTSDIRLDGALAALAETPAVTLAAGAALAARINPMIAADITASLEIPPPGSTTDSPHDAIPDATPDSGDSDGNSDGNSDGHGSGDGDRHGGRDGHGGGWLVQRIGGTAIEPAPGLASGLAPGLATGSAALDSRPHEARRADAGRTR